MTICMNMSHFINLAAIFSLDLESQFTKNFSPEKRILPGLVVVFSLVYVIVAILFYIRYV